MILHDEKLLKKADKPKHGRRKSRPVSPAGIGLKVNRRKQVFDLFNHEFLFARDMFFAPVNSLIAAIREAILRANAEADTAVSWKLDKD